MTSFPRTLSATWRRAFRWASGKTLTALPEKVQQGIDEGWIWKADSAEALAEACGMENLADTLEAYNGYCATGVDEEMFKEAQSCAPWTPARCM